MAAIVNVNKSPEMEFMDSISIPLMELTGIGRPTEKFEKSRQTQPGPREDKLRLLWDTTVYEGDRHILQDLLEDMPPQKQSNEPGVMITM